MEMPQPDARHQQFHRLAGTWQGVETMHPSPWDPGGSQADGCSVVKIALGGFYAIVDCPWCSRATASTRSTAAPAR